MRWNEPPAGRIIVLVLQPLNLWFRKAWRWEFVDIDPICEDGDYAATNSWSIYFTRYYAKKFITNLKGTILIELPRANGCGIGLKRLIW